MNETTKVAIGLLGMVAVLACVWTFSAVPEASGFAAGLLKAVLAVALFALADRYVLPGDACEEVIGRRNVAYAVMLVALAVLVGVTVATAAPVGAGMRPVVVVERAGLKPALTGHRTGASGAAARPAHVVVALGEVGTVEATGRNDGPRVEAYLASVGLSRGAPWCGAFVAWVLDRAGVDGPRDRRGVVVRSATALGYRRGAGTVDARLVLRGAWRPPDGTLVVWRRGDSWQGHVGIVDRWRAAADGGRCGATVEGNTSSGRAGSQRDRFDASASLSTGSAQREGDGVWRRWRCVSAGSALRIVAFVPVGRTPSGGVPVVAGEP